MTIFNQTLFKGKTAVVTGGTSGIGAGIATYLARHGATVYAVGLGADKVSFAAALNIIVKEVDVTQTTDLTDLFNSLDRLDILVPAAGISMGEKEVEYDNFLRVLSIQLEATYHTISLAYPLLKKSEQGNIVTIASMYSYFGGGARVAYSTAKGGVVQLTKSLAELYAKDKIRINAVAPGWIETPLLAPLKADEYLSSRILSRTPLNRFGSTEEIAKAVAFLSSDGASFITGAILPVDGGYLVTGI